jgi:hypothetical protein
MGKWITAIIALAFVLLLTMVLTSPDIQQLAQPLF